MHTSEIKVSQFFLYSECKQKDALLYCKLQHCRVDCTGQVGPSSFRKLKLKTDPIKIYKGQQIAGDVQHDFEGQMYATYHDVLENENETVQNIFDAQVQNSHSDYIKKMKILRVFYDELDQKYNFSRLSDSQLRQKLKELSDDKILRDNTPKFYLKGYGNKYFEVAELMGKDKEQNVNGNIFEYMDAFKNVIPNAEKSNYVLKQKFIDNPFFSDQYESKVKVDLERRNKILKQLNKTYKGEVKLDPENDQDYGAYQAYKEDYNKSKYFMDTKEFNQSSDRFMYANMKFLRQKKAKLDDLSINYILEQIVAPLQNLINLNSGQQVQYLNYFNQNQELSQIQQAVSMNRIQTEKLLPQINSETNIEQQKKNSQKKIHRIRASQLMQFIRSDTTANELAPNNNQNEKQNYDIKHQKLNSFIEFERKLDELAQHEQNKITVHRKSKNNPPSSGSSPRRLSLFKINLKNKLGLNDLIQTNRNLMKLKVSFETERSRFYSKIESDNSNLNPYQLKQRQHEYSYLIKDRLSVKQMYNKQQIITETAKIQKEDEYEDSAKELLKNILKNCTREGDPLKQVKVKQILMNRNKMRAEDDLKILPTQTTIRIK